MQFVFHSIFHALFTRFSIHSDFYCNFHTQFAKGFSLFFWQLFFSLIFHSSHTENSSWQFSDVDFSPRTAWCMPWRAQSSAAQSSAVAETEAACSAHAQSAQNKCLCRIRGWIFKWRHLTTAGKVQSGAVSVEQQLRVCISIGAIGATRDNRRVG